MLLDTNALSALAEGDSALLSILRSDRPWYLPSIALGEYRFGVLNSVRRAALECWIDDLEKACEVLSPDAQTARLYATIRTKLRDERVQMPYHDMWIAAIAVQHDLEIVTRDAHFDRIPSVRRIAWQ